MRRDAGDAASGSAAASASNPRWAGSGNPAGFQLDLPLNPNLVGIDLYAQGAVFDPTKSNGIGVTNGLRITIGA